MPTINSNVGKTTSKFTPIRNLIVDDPTQLEEEIVQQNQPNVLPPRDHPVRMSPEQYNQMRTYLDSQKQTATTNNGMYFESSEPIIEDDVSDIHPVSQEDMNMMSMFMKPDTKQTSSIDFNTPKLNTLNKNSKNRIEVLLGLKKILVYKEIDDHKIGLRNVRSAQVNRVLQEVGKQQTNLDQIYTLKHMMLAFALDSIDGENISSILGQEDTEELRLEIIKNMDPSVVDELYDIYVKEISSKINAKSNKETAETIEDIKK